MSAFRLNRRAWNQGACASEWGGGGEREEAVQRPKSSRFPQAHRSTAAEHARANFLPTHELT